jgi:hypothetical protein
VSVAVTVKVLGPGVVGTPLMTPLLMLKPVGKPPTGTAKV